MIMNIFSKIFPIRKHFKSQPNKPNRHVLILCRGLRFPEENIRRALVDLNGVNIARIADGVGMRTIYGALKGENKNTKAREILAGSLGLTVEELFEKDNPQA